MSTMWRKTMVYLGLVEEPDEQEEHELARREGEPTPHQAAERRTERVERPGPSRGRPGPRREDERRPREGATIRPLHTGDSHVRQLDGGAVRVGIVRAATFDDAEHVGERYRAGFPVLLDLTEVDTKVGRRLLDFVSGVIYALRGRIQPAGGRAFLLIPDGVEIPSEERRRLADLGYRVRPQAASAEDA